jgi:hypothetical protein
MRTKAERRQHKFRIREKVRLQEFHNGMNWGVEGADEKWGDEYRVLRRAENRKSCSCSMCSLPRKGGWVSGPSRYTLQELRHADNTKQEWE